MIDKNSLIVLAGDIYQIESIEFGNWFYYVKNIIKSQSVVELTNTWRTEEENLKGLWEEVRNRDKLVATKLVIDGPFSKDIGETLFEKMAEDEVVLCLNYAVSIHKSQGLEYDSVKIVIPKSNTDKISHGIFYTAITRAKKYLKIFWSAETMQKVIDEFNYAENGNYSFEIIKSKLLNT